jgi:VCBS repeat-containing protein
LRLPAFTCADCRRAERQEEETDVPTYTGTNGNDTINGSNGDDTINGLGGSDTINGGNGSDTIDGGGGDDVIDGGNSNDTIQGGTGNDTINGGNGNDVIDGGADNDNIDGGNGNDTIFGNAGNDNLLGDNGDDSFTGGAGDDIIDGGNGFDTAYYSGAIGEYNFSNSGGYLHIAHFGGAGPDGHDQVKRVERLVFLDRTIIIGGGGNNAPVAVDDHVSINEDTGTYSSGAASVKDNDFDFEGQPLTVTPGVFTGTYGTLTLNANGTYSYTLFASAQALAQGQNVTDSFNYTLSDGSSTDTGALVFHIAGVNDAPVAHADTAAGTENQVLTVNVLANDTDVDNGAVLTVTAASAPPGQGTASVVGNQVQFNPGTNFDHLAVGATQVVVVNYSIQDQFGATSSSTLTITVTGTNDGPVANADTAATTENASVLVNVLANDTDADDGAVLTVTAASAPSGQGSASVVSNQVQFNPGTDFDHLAAGATQVVVVGYSIQDQHGATSSSTISITVTGTNDGPVANPDTGATTENASVLINVLANDTDVDDGAVLTVTTASAPSGQGSASVVSNQVQFNPGTDFDHLALGATQVVVVNYSIQDQFGATSSSTISITVTGTNDGPVANPDTAAGHENQVLTIDVLANDTDVDDGAVLTITSATTLPGNGSVSIVANQLVFDPGTDFDHVPEGASFPIQIDYTIEDEHGASSSSTVTITITGTNDGPVANPDIATTAENNTVSIDVVANDTDVDDAAVLFVTAASAPPGQGSVSIVSNQVVFDPGTDFDYLAVGESVNVVLNYDIEDEHGAPASSTVTVTVTGTNDAPTIDAGGTDDSGAVTELPDGDAGENVTVHSDSGTIAFDDLDLSDTHSASFTPQSGGYLGSFTLDPVDQMGDSVGWDFNVSDAALDGLADGQIVTQVYTIEIDDGHGGTALQDVTITLTGAADGPQTVWYIDNSALGSANLGTQADPYTSIAAFNAAQGTPGGPQVGATVYLLAGTGTYAEADGINLLDDQILTGVGQPTIAPLAGDGVDLAQNNTLSGFDIVTTTGIGIADGGGSVGNLSVSDVAISGSAQIADIDQGGTLNVTLNSAASTGSSGGAIDLASVGGSFTITGATTIVGVHSGGGIDITGSSVVASFGGGGTVSTAGATGVNYVGNSGSLTIGGGFDIVTTSGAGLNASGGGTVTVTGAGNSVTSTTGTAVTISGTDIGLAGITFESVSANGAVNGIVLSNTGTNAGVHGGLTITGDAGSANNGSGGTIQNTTGAGISLTNTRDTNLDQVTVQNGLDDGIRGSNVTNFTLTNSTVTNNGNASGEHGADFSNLFGAGTFTNTVFSNNEASQVSIINTSGTASLAFTGLSASSNGLAAAPNGLHGLHVETQGTASADLIVLDSAFNNLFSNSVHAINQGTGTLEVTVATTDFTNVGASAINIVQNAAGTVRFYIHDNDTFLRGTNTGSSHTININQTAGAPVGSVMEGAISNNVIGSNASSTSANTAGDGVRILATGPGTTTVRIDGNNIQGVGSNGINVQMSGSNNAAHTLNATIFGNIVTATSATSADAIRVVAGAAANDAGILRLDMHDNIGSATVGNDFSVRQRFATTVQLLNYVGGNTNIAQVQAYLDVTRNNDPTGPGTDWFISTQAPGGGFANTASVPLPTLPSPLLAAGPPPAGHIIGNDNILSQADVDQLTAAAIQRWADSGATADQLAAMRAVSVTVADMAGPFVGSSHSGEISLDSDGAGFGWFIDTTPGEDGEFDGAGAHLSAAAGGAAEGRIDALTVLMHELGHQIGLADNYHDGGEAELMHGFVDVGERRLPGNAFETGMGGGGEEFPQSQVMMFACSPLFQADMMLG